MNFPRENPVNFSFAGDLISNTHYSPKSKMYTFLRGKLWHQLAPIVYQASLHFYKTFSPLLLISDVILSVTLPSWCHKFTEVTKSNSTLTSFLDSRIKENPCKFYNQNQPYRVNNSSLQKINAPFWYYFSLFYHFW